VVRDLGERALCSLAVLSLCALLLSSVLCVSARARGSEVSGSILDAGDEIVVISPNATDEWRIGTTHEITWSWVGDFSYVSIVLCPGWASQTIISDNTSNDGSFEWVVQPAWYGGPASYYWVRISNVDDSMVFDDSDSFFIYMGTISVSSPSSGETLQAGSGYQIAWWSDTAGAEVSIEFYKGGAYDSTIAASWGNSNGYSYYYWYLPIMVWGDDFQIKVTSLSAPSIFDFSDNFSITCQPYLYVTSPRSGDRWEAGTTHSITWSSHGTGSYVNISLYDWNYGGLTTIALYEANDGLFEWAIPIDQHVSSTLEVLIQSVSANSTNISLYDYSDQFEIYGPSITVTSPAYGNTWMAGEEYEITWTSYNAGSEVKIVLSCPYSTIVSSTENDGSYIWSIPLTLVQGNYGTNIAVSSISKSWVTGTSSFFNLMSATRQWLNISRPAAGEHLGRGMSYQISWMSGNSPGPYVSLELFQGGSYVATIAPFLNSPEGWWNWGNYIWNVPHTLAVGGGYQIKVESLSNASAYCMSDEFFVFDPSAPSGVPGWIDVISPNGVTWWSGSTYLIQWSQWGDSGGAVAIELWLNDAYHSIIASSTPNNGSYQWTIPSITSSPYYKIRVVSTSDSTVYDFGSVAVIPPQPWIRLSSVQYDLYVNRTSELLWSSGNSAGDFVSIDVYHTENVQGSGQWVWYSSISGNTSNDGEFSWTVVPVSSTTTDSYEIIIRSLSKNWVYDATTVWIISNWIAVDAPDDGDVLLPGTSYEIRWSSNGVGDKVTIRGEWDDSMIIAENTTNDGSYIWMISETLWTGSEGYLEISSSSGGVYGYADPLYIGSPNAAQKAISVVSPDGGESWSVGTSHSVIWTSTNDIGKVNIELYYNGSYDSTLAIEIADSHSYVWAIPSSISGGGGYRIKVVSYLDSNVFDFSNQSFAVVAPAAGPFITVASPFDGSSWQRGSTHVITWTSTGNVSHVKIDLCKGGALASTIASNEANDGSYTWAIPSSVELGTEYCVVVSSSDDQSVAGSSNGLFSITGVTEQPAETQSIALPVAVSLASLLVAIAAIGFALSARRGGGGKG
jgi:hypothetical protein